MVKRFEIRNSTAEFLTFIAEGKEDGVQVVYRDETIWATQKAMSQLFDVDRTVISKHLKNIFESSELQQDSVCAKFAHTAEDGKTYNTQFYNLDAIISVGYRVNSTRATQFRQWCTFVLRQFAIRGYVIDKKRMENGSFIGIDYFEHLLAEIREIRLSERRFYQKLTDIYATAIDYNRYAPTTRLFFKKIQNKMHYATHGHTAAELIVERANAEKEHMGLTTWENAPDGKIVKTDVSIAKNYLKGNEPEVMGRLVNATLDMAEVMANRHIPMTMEDWAIRIDKILELTDNAVLQDITLRHQIKLAMTYEEKYRELKELSHSDNHKVKEAADAWLISIGLQAAAQLKVSAFLLDLAVKNVKGEISRDEVRRRLNEHYGDMPVAEPRSPLDGGYEIIPPDSPKLKEINEYNRKLRPALYAELDKKRNKK